MSVPISLPATRFWLVPEPSMSTPSPLLPELTLRAPGVVPPLVLPVEASSITTPTLALPSAPLPSPFVPIRLRATRVFVAPSRSTPSPPLSANKLPVPADVPPMVLAGESTMSTPSAWFSDLADSIVTGADVVTLHQVAGGAVARDEDAVAIVRGAGRDEVSSGIGGPADRVAGAAVVDLDPTAVTHGAVPGRIDADGISRDHIVRSSVQDAAAATVCRDDVSRPADRPTDRILITGDVDPVTGIAEWLYPFGIRADHISHDEVLVVADLDAPASIRRDNIGCGRDGAADRVPAPATSKDAGPRVR